MAIPNGYRLLTAEDIGKTFGVELELDVYINSDEYPISTFPTGTSAEITNFAEVKWEYEAGFEQNMHVIYIENSAVFKAGWIFTNAYGSNIYTMSNNVKVESYNTNTDWNTWFYVKDKSDPKTQFITDMDNLAKSIVDKAGSSGKKTIKEMKTLVDGLKTEFVTQEKTITPTKSSQAITPDSGKDGLSKVTVNAIPNEYIVPSGTLNITENGTHDVTSKASVVVNISGGSASEEWDGSYTESDLGYTVTLELGTYGSRNPFELGFTFTYSIDGGVTKIPLSGQTTPIVLNSVQTIGFYDTSAAALYLGTSISGNELGYVHGGNGVYEKIINVENDMIIYVSVSATNAGGGSD